MRRRIINFLSLEHLEHCDPRKNERGNVLFMILIAIALIGLLTAAVQSTNRPEGVGIDKEALVIRASEFQRYASELERAVQFIQQNGVSESDIRFAHPNASADYGDLSADTDPREQVFHREGGGANYRDPPDDVNDGSAWEFYGGTHIPGVGRSDRAELVAVLPYVTQQFCDKINALNGQNGTPADTGAGAAGGVSPGDCVQGGAAARFDSGQQFYASPNTMSELSTSFTHDPNTAAPRPALQACVVCSANTNGANGTDDERHVYHVLMAR